MRRETIRPDLHEWMPTEDDLFYTYENDTGIVKALYEKWVGIIEAKTTLPIFYIKKSHYKKKMEDILLYSNYFTKFYDLDLETFFATLTVKYIVDTQPYLSHDDFVTHVIKKIATPSFIAKCKLMAKDLYTLNIVSEDSDRYKASPKINNSQARQIIATSFAFRFLIPICIHFTNVNQNIDQKNKTAYLKTFYEIYNIVINKFEVDDIKFVNALRDFVSYRTTRLFKNNKTIFEQKKMLRGDTVETVTDELIEEVIFVKTLYKLDYRKSCVSYIDGVVSNSGTNYLREKYPAKPFLIDSQETSNDGDDMSPAEVLEMISYIRDESSIMVDDVNRKKVLSKLDSRYQAFDISEEEIDFYIDNCKISTITKFLLRSYYANIFKDSYAIDGMSKRQLIRLLIMMKRVFSISKMPMLSYICTSVVNGKYKENMIKNSKVIEEIETSNIWNDIIKPKFKYLIELETKGNPIFSTLTGLLNAEYTLVEYDSSLDQNVILSIDPDQLKNEYLLFLSII